MAAHVALTPRERLWMTLFITSLSSTFVFGWVFSAITEAILFGCPINTKMYCDREWRNTMAVLWPLFLALFVASCIWLGTVLILRVTPWYRRGARNVEAPMAQTPNLRARRKAWVIMLVIGSILTAVFIALTVGYLFAHPSIGLWAAFCALAGASFIFTMVVVILRFTVWYKGRRTPVKDVDEESLGEAPGYEESVIAGPSTANSEPSAAAAAPPKLPHVTSYSDDIGKK